MTLDDCLVFVGTAGLAAGSGDWLLLPQAALGADHEHAFARELAGLEAGSHVRLDLYPDGGVSRRRFFGRLAR